MWSEISRQWSEGQGEVAGTELLRSAAQQVENFPACPGFGECPDSLLPLCASVTAAFGRRVTVIVT